MKRYTRQNRQPASRFMLFPFFSLLCHLILFFFFTGANLNHTPPEIKEDELVAMVDLKDLLPPEEILAPPEPEVPSLPSPPKIVLSPFADEADGLDGLPVVSEGEIGEPENIPVPVIETEEPPESAPDSEEVDDLTESDPIPETPAEILSDVDDDSIPETESATETNAGPEEADLAEEKMETTVADAEEPSAEPVSAEEELAMTESESSNPEPAEAARPEMSATSSEPTEPDSDPARLEPLKPPVLLAQERQKGESLESSLPTTHSESGRGGLIKEGKVMASSPPKPSKEKVKKVGLLGLLGSKKGGRRGRSPLLAKGLSRTRKRHSQARGKASQPTATGTKQVAMLKRNLLSSQRNRLMKRRKISRHRKSKIKIVHGSGHNYGVISSAIEQKRGRLTTVYSGLLQRNPELQGNLIIEFTISSEGKVVKSRILTSSLGDPHFEKALMREVLLWQFPAIKKGETTVLYPLSFFPAS